MITPIRPDEVAKEKGNLIPQEMIKAINNCITRKWDGKQSTVTQNEIIAEYVDIKDTVNNQLTRNMIFSNGWLDFEPLFREYGWNIVFDKPGYNETGNAYFVFSKKEDSLTNRYG